jgi:hypothetical protein
MPKGCHLLPCAVGIPRRFNSRAIAALETKPALRSLRIVAARAVARASAARLCANLIFALPLPTVIRPKRISVLLTELRCQRPPRPPDSPFRFNLVARPRSETKPAAMSFRMVGSKARARASAALLLAAPPRILRLRDEVFPPGCFIRTPWPDGGVLSWQWFSVKIVSEGLATGR